MINGEKVIFTMATIEKRTESLKVAVNSIINQCDKLYVYLNDFASIPQFLIRDKVKVFHGKEYPNVGDIGKFWNADLLEGYHFTVDDDIIYPKDYSKRMINMIEKYNRKIIVGVHGSRLRVPCHNYFRTRTHVHFRRQLKEPFFVNVVGTGTAAFHTSTIKICKDDFDKPNMADIYFCLKAQEQSVPMILIDRKDFWLQDTKKYNPRESIYAHTVNKTNGDNPQTNLINEYHKKHGFKLYKI